MFKTIANHLKTPTLSRIRNFYNAKTQFQFTFINQHFSSLTTRRRKPAAGKLSREMENEAMIEQKKKRTEFQVKDMLESAATGIFIPRNKHGEEVTMGEYLEFASLSPWVPCPDAVARRALDIAGANEKDIHYELGCGDGRLNFFALDLYKVKKSVGVDIDPSMVSQSMDRIARRHPAPQNISFVCADLIDETNETSDQIWKSISNECTILTMYFVEDALDKLKPFLEKHVLGKKCKILTIGYQIREWEPKWVEIVLGLTITMYDMENIDELLNRSTKKIEVSQEDVELNRKSREILAAKHKDEDTNNPFVEQRLKATHVHEEDPDVIMSMDFDENKVYDDDDVIIKR